MKILTGLLALFFLSTTAYSQIEATVDLRRETQYDTEPPVSISINFTHTAADFVNNSTITEPIDLSFYQFKEASIQINSSTLVSGSIGNASYQIYLSASANVSQATGGEINQAYRAQSSDLTVWGTIPVIDKYGTHLIHTGASRFMFVQAHGVDNVARTVSISLK